MSDVVAVALITAAGSFLVAAAAAAAAIAAAKSSRDVELERIRAENSRLVANHQEAERQNRKGTYHRLLNVLSDLATYAVAPPPIDTFRLKTEQWREVRAAVDLFGSPGVKRTLDPIRVLLGAVLMECGDAGSEDQPVRWGAALTPRLDEFTRVRHALSSAIAEDLSLVGSEKGLTEITK